MLVSVSLMQALEALRHPMRDLMQALEALRDPQSGPLAAALQWEPPGSEACTELCALMRQLEDTVGAVGHQLQVRPLLAVCTGGTVIFPPGLHAIAPCDTLGASPQCSKLVLMS